MVRGVFIALQGLVWLLTVCTCTCILAGCWCVVLGGTAALLLHMSAAAVCFAVLAAHVLFLCVWKVPLDCLLESADPAGSPHVPQAASLSVRGICVVGLAAYIPDMTTFGVHWPMG